MLSNIPKFPKLLFMPLKIDESWTNYFAIFNKSSLYLTKVFPVLDFQFLQNFVSFLLVNGQILLLHIVCQPNVDWPDVCVGQMSADQMSVDQISVE